MLGPSLGHAPRRPGRSHRRSTIRAVAPVPASLTYGLDIETDTRRGGLDPRRAGVVAVAVSSAAGLAVVTGEERHLLAELDALLMELPPGVIVTWYGGVFDLPFLDVRARRHGLSLGLRLSELSARPSTPRLAGAPYHRPARPPRRRRLAAWGPHAHLDACLAWRSLPSEAGRGAGLKEVARRNGLVPVEVDRSAIHLLSADTLRRYVASDAILCRLLALSHWDGLAPSIDAVATRPPSGLAPPNRPSGDRPPAT